MSSSVAESSTAAATIVAAKDGDWTCSDNDCHHINFARRTQCNKCHRERSIDENPTSTGGSGGSSSSKKKLGTEIGKAAAEKSRGLFSAEDWQCSKCANVNWARRQTCNMCNAPKFSDVEERTGYGGGYNDRGVVEYKERVESDSEYDEFGRLKKRKNKDDTRSQENKSKKIHESVARDEPKREQKEEDDDEDDEEDDGGDLSKYDLWGDDEIDAIAPAAAETAQSNLTKNDTQKPKNSSTKLLTAKKGKMSPSCSTSSSSSTSSSTSSSSSASSSSSSSSTSSSRSSSPAVRSRSRSPFRRSLSKEKISRSNSLKTSSIILQRHRSRERSKTHSQHSHTSSSRKHHRNIHTSKSRSCSRSRSSTSSSSTSAKRKARSSNSAASRSPRANKRVARRTRSRSLSRQRH